MSIIPVAASSLRKRAVQLGDRCLAEASLFPFFGRSGEVCAILLLTRDSPEIFALSWMWGLVRIPFRGPMRIAANWMDLRGVADPVARLWVNAWHFDPWWVLKEEPYVSHRMAPGLKVTNCVGRGKRKVSMLYFRRDLSRVSFYTARESNSVGINRWNNDLLPDPPVAIATPCPAKARCPAWVLDPMWQ